MALARRLTLALVVVCATGAHAGAQELTGTLGGVIRDEQGGVLSGATIHVESPALPGGPRETLTNDRGRFRLLGLPPGTYALAVRLARFAPSRLDGIRIGAGAAIDQIVVLKVAGPRTDVVVPGDTARIDARNPGVESRFGPDELRTIPTRRSGMFDFVRASPGISPTSFSSGTVTTVSSFGSGTNENLFLIDDTNMTCPCNGIARAEVGTDFIHEVRVLGAGGSVDLGNMQGAVVNIITKSGTNRVLHESAYFSQTDALTSHPVQLRVALAPGTTQSPYTRVRYRDFTTSTGGPFVHDRGWFFAGYQYLRDFDSQPGTDAALPRKYEQNKFFGKLTWRLTPNWLLVQSLHYERWVNPDRPTIATPPDATVRSHASVPAMTFAQLTHTSARTFWEFRAGRFEFDRADDPASGDRTTAGRFDTETGFASGGPRNFGGLTLSRTTAKAMATHYLPALLGADHQLKLGVQFERGEHNAVSVIPGGTRYVDRNGQPFQAVSSLPSNVGGRFISSAAFLSDALTVNGRLTVSAGVRVDHHRAISQDLRAVDLNGQETSQVISGRGTLYVWNLLSPRLGLAAGLTADGRTMLRMSYGRFRQGVLTGELAMFHPGATDVTTTAFDPATGGYTNLVSIVSPNGNLTQDPDTRAPRTDEYSFGIDREVGSRVTISAAWIRKRGAHFIGWTDTGGVYVEETRIVNGQPLQVLRLVNSTANRQFLLTNPADYALAYDGLVLAIDRRQAGRWQATASYTFSRATGLQPSSGATASAAQVSTISPPPAPGGLTFGRDPNDLTNARGVLPNDRPHVFQAMGSVRGPRGFLAAAHLQYGTGKPWAASVQVPLPQGNQRILIESPGTRRLSSQTLLDLRVSRAFRVGALGSVELIFDLLNALNDTAAEAIATDNAASLTFGQPTVFVDPRRAMLSVRFALAAR